MGKAKKKVSTLSCTELKYDNPSIIHNSLKQNLGYLLHKTTLLFKTKSSEKLAHLGLHGYHFATLLIIEAENSINQMQVCTETGVDKATMVKTIDHLEDLKLVERIESKSDRRSKHLHLTKKGLSVLEKAKKIRAECEKEFLDSLGEEKAKVFKETLLLLVESKQVSKK